MEEEYTDQDGYPTESAEKRIREWPMEEGFVPLLEFVGELWYYPFYWEQHHEDRIFWVSTGGWSGNESLIYALKENNMFWLTCWLSSRVGGHYMFEVPENLAQPKQDG